ncbi:MAG TPA: 3',5'-cyclic-AMP phosphodiesterase [Steroidobacteraceae bacterium]|nr:3',5'-cyclic-AMP phosphodiesterase [Steroidobacteraceae bacterium]
MNDEVRVLHLSDPHLFASPQGCLRGVDSLASLRQVLAHAVARMSRVDAVLCTGDIVNDEPAGYAHFARELGTLGKPVYCIPGNHDDPARLRSALSAPPFQVGGLADLGAWRIILLDSCVPGRAGGHIGQTQLQALQAALTGSERHALVCVHHHPVSMASRWLDAVGIDNADAFFEVLDAHPQVRAIAWGHVHQFFDARRRGVRLLATPSTCAQFLPQSDTFALDARPPAYRRLTLCADGSIETQVVWLEPAAQVLDTAADRRG